MDTLFYLAARALDRNGIDPDNIDVNTKDPMKMAMSRKYCKVGKCPESWQTMKYRPNIGGNAFYMVCFFVLFGGHLWFGIRSRTWTFMGTMCAGILGEIVGYIGRIMLNLNPFLMDNFLINLVPLTIAPALITAGIYMCLGRVIVATGAENSRLKPKMYTYIFVGCDLLSLVLQAVGGGMAATNSKGSRRGVDIMIAGLISQVITMALFLILWADFALRTRRTKNSGTLSRIQPAMYDTLRSNRNFVFFQWGLFIATVLIFIRCIYRVAELWEGFNGKLANHESTFMIFEGPMIIIAIAAITIFHPGRVFGNFWIQAGKGVGSRGKSVDGGDGLIQMKNSTTYYRVDRPGTVV